MFEKCIAGLMHVDVYFSASETQPVCHFNQFRSRQKYQEFCNRLLGQVWKELNMRNLQEFERRYLEIQLEEMGKLFVLEDGKVVAHRNVLVFRDKSAVELGGVECAMPLPAVGIPEHPIPGVVRIVPAVPGVCAACAGELCVAGGCDCLAGVV